MAVSTQSIGSQITGLPLVSWIKLEDYLEDFVKGANHMIVKDLIKPMLESNDLHKSFSETIQLHSAITGAIGIIISTRYKPTELVDVLVEAYGMLQKDLINLEPYLKEKTVSVLAALDAQFEYTIGFIEILQKNAKHILKIQLQQYVELTSYAMSLNLCLCSLISVAKGEVKISEINEQNLRTLAQWSEHYAAQLMIKAQKLNVTDGNRLNEILGREKTVSDFFKGLQE